MDSGLFCKVNLSPAPRAAELPDSLARRRADVPCHPFMVGLAFALDLAHTLFAVHRHYKPPLPKRKVRGALRVQEGEYERGEMRTRSFSLWAALVLLVSTSGLRAQSGDALPTRTKGVGHVLLAKAQAAKQPPYLEFGDARVSLGMTVAQVERNLAAAGRHLKFLDDGQPASGMTEQVGLVTLNHITEPSGDGGQVTFYNGRVGYAAFQFSGTLDAVVLAQELEGAIENVDARNCSLENFTAHGTGGGHTDSIFTCGSKTIRVTTIEPIGENRSVNVSIEIGTTAPGSP